MQQVLRYSALGAGLFYGLYHQAKLSSAAKLAAVNKEYEHRQSLINQAKAEYTKKSQPKSEETGSMFDVPVHPSYIG
jgi:F-type H+-transporting ATP synthase subunit e